MNFAFLDSLSHILSRQAKIIFLLSSTKMQKQTLNCGGGPFILYMVHVLTK